MNRDNQFKGTQGEWLVVPTEAVNESGQPLYYNIETKDPYKHIGSVSGYDVPGYEENAVPKEEVKANAALMAAAPELLSMLQQLIAEEQILPTNYFYPYIQEVINKATPF